MRGKKKEREKEEEEERERRRRIGVERVLKGRRVKIMSSYIL